MFRDIANHLIEHWYDYFPEQKMPRRIRPLFMRGNKWNVVYVFVDKEPKPHCVVEIAKGESALLKNAAENMNKIKDNAILSQFCPRLFYFGCVGTNDMLIQQFCDGIPLLFILQSRFKVPGVFLKERYIQIATEWLIRFHQLTTTKYLYLDKNNLGEVFSIILDLTKKNKDIARLASSLKNKKLPLVMTHRDYIPANILVNKEELKILDWEYAASESFPLWDLFNFLLWAYRDIKVSDKELYSFISSVFLEEKCMRGRVVKAIKTYCGALSIDRELALILFFQWLYSEFRDTQIINEMSLNYQRLFCYLE